MKKHLISRTEAQSVGEIIEQYLEQEQLTGAVDQQRAVAIWPEVVGPGINRYTVSRDVQGSTLYVKISSSALRNELAMTRTEIIKSINQRLGKEIITEIVFQ